MAVTRLEADREELCPREVVTITAETTPPAGHVLWRYGEGPSDWFGMVNGVPALNIGFDANGNPILPSGVIAAEGDTIRMRSGRGATRVITATHSAAGEQPTSLSVTITWKEADLEIKLDPSPRDVPYLITAEPKMQPSVITVQAIGVGGSISVSEWKASAGLSSFDDCPPHGPDNLNTVFDFAPAGTGEQITVSFNDVIRGGFFSVSVQGTVQGCPVAGTTGGGIEGTNPQQSDIQAALPHDTLRRIACKESGQRQFDAPPNGGIGFCPLFGPGGRVGVLQIADPTADEVWNWRANIAKGIELFNEKVDAARDYPNKVRNSAAFQDLVGQFNQKRQQEGLAPIVVVLPDFTTGNFDDNLQQLELDAIRGYNGWEGSDRFGFERHEFRVAVDGVDGEEVLIVVNINEETLRGEAVWERVPVADRPTAIGLPDYVEEVLAFDFGCSPAPTPTCPTVSTIIVDPSDTKTHAIPGKSTSFPLFIRHLVTVRGGGDIVLRAVVFPDSPRLRSLLTWEADGAVITSPALGADRLTAKISRFTPSAARIPVRIKVGNQICHEVVVWIIWCTLAPSTVGASSINGRPLGLRRARLAAGGYYSRARIDWTATVEPAAIIMDIDRPAIEDQERVPPPGSNDGVAGPGNNDATGSGFSGWDISRQKRRRVFKGNPDKVPPEPIAETTAADPEPLDQAIADYPADDVEGNDDNGVGADEDSNPYDEGAGVPGQGTRGTLRAHDRPRRSFMDADDHSGNPPGEDGDTYRIHSHFREFVRVQLGATWYRCSYFGLWRWHMNAKRLSGAWDGELGQPDVLDTTNDGF